MTPPDPRVRAERRAKALKLLEAIVEPCLMDEEGDHEWRKCRSCLARNELDLKHVRELLRDFLSDLATEARTASRPEKDQSDQ